VLLFALSFLLLATGCTITSIDEGASYNAALCTPGKKLQRADCDQGLICVPDSNRKTGRCLKNCGKSVDGMLTKDPSACSDELRCLRKKDAQLRTIGMFCTDFQSEENQSCESPYDEDACGEGLRCVPINADRSLCKEECSFDKKCQNLKSLCRLEKPHRLEKQNEALCEIEACLAKDLKCTCKKGQGYNCYEAFPNASFGHCYRPVGVCENRAKWA
jgi:hypothetical protein